jgi:hypothetical protein
LENGGLGLSPNRLLQRDEGAAGSREKKEIKAVQWFIQGAPQPLALWRAR